MSIYLGLVMFNIAALVFFCLLFIILSEYTPIFSLSHDNEFLANKTIKLPSSITWIQYFDNNENLLFTQTEDGNLYKFIIGANKSNGDTNFDIREDAVYNISASKNSGPLILNSIKDTMNSKIISISDDENMAIIDIYANSIRWINNTKLSSLTKPVIYDINNKQIILAISVNGTLLQFDPYNNFTSKNLGFSNLLPDSRIVVNDVDNDGFDEVLLLSNPTERYPHGALGDTIEAEKLIILENCGDIHDIFKFCLKNMLNPPNNKVFESISPLVVNLFGSDHVHKQIALIASDDKVGSNVVVYGIDSKIIFSSEPIGKPFRWMLISGYGYFNGPKLVVNEVPHLEGVVKFMDKKGRTIIETSGYSSHSYGSRNIDSATIYEYDDRSHITNKTIHNNNSNDNDVVIIPSLNKESLNVLSVTSDNRIILLRTFLLDSSITSNILAKDVDENGIVDIIVGDKLGSVYFLNVGD